MPKRKTDKEIIEEARKRFKLAEEAEREIRKEAVIDLQFAAGDQWEATDRNAREYGGAKRPCLTFNRLHAPLNMVSNEARQNQPGIEVHPVDFHSDPDTAMVYEGMIRHIEYTSKADEVYETALEQSTKGSFGVFKIVADYCGGKTFDQELRIERVPNPFSVYIDPFARRADRADMMWAFETEVIPKDEYLREYGRTEVAKSNFFAGTMNPAPDWVGNDGVLVASYWFVEIEKKTLIQVRWPDGKTSAEYDDELPDEMPEGIELAIDEDGNTIAREVEVRRVRCCKINGVEILDDIEWAGQWIPFLFVPGEELYVDNKRHLFSLIRFARDPQKLYNFYRSSEAETVMLGTKAPWVGVKGAFRDAAWATANTIPHAYLQYEPLDIAGNPAPPPQRNIAEPPIQALSVGAAQAADDIKATTSVYDASLGAQSNETSGIAIQRRQNQSGLSNYHFVDNLNRAIRQCGVILCDLIPKIYDTAREVRILGEDRQQQIVKVNQRYIDEKGIERHYDLSAGKYDVTITVGPSYTTQRQEGFEVLTQLAQAYPPLMQIAGDIIFTYADIPGAEKIAERMRKTLPPALAEEQEGAPTLPPALQAQIGQMANENEQLKALVAQQNDEIRSKKIETDSRERIELLKIEADDRQAALDAQVKLIEAELKAKSTEDITLLREQIRVIQSQLARMMSGAAAEEEAAETAPPRETQLSAVSEQPSALAES